MFLHHPSNIDSQREAGVRRRVAVLVTIVFLAAVPSSALEIGENLFIHGFGGWAFAQTDENLYLIGDENGVWDNVQLSLNFTADIAPRARVVAQVAMTQEDELETDLDYAFGEWKFSDRARLRLGRVKHPFGIYAEIFDVGTLRPFYMLPQSIYGPQGITAKSVDGIGFLGILDSPTWSVSYDLYAGEIQGTLQVPGPFAADPDDRFQSEVVSDFEVEDVFGLRLEVSPPLAGLRFGLSAYTGEQTVVDVQQATTKQSYDVVGVHIGYEDEKWLARAEASRFDLGDDAFGADGAYAELAYHVTENWQLAVRWDWWQGDNSGLDLTQLPPFVNQLLENEDLGFAINYWFTPRFVVKLNYHVIKGNRFAFPDDPDEILRAFFTQQLEDETEMIVFGVQFSF
ncbi:MAG: hypothetical protein MPN21_16405 [Thermoanaerobaculia bacterium]|nr:hypothetical protein [Thermoanaerobaculia bacterium]